MKNNFLTSEVLEEWSEPGPTIGGGVFAALVMMFVSMILGMATSVATPVWVMLWIAIPLLTMAFPHIRILHPANRVKNSDARKALGRYYSLTNEEKKYFPYNYAELLRTRDMSDKDVDSIVYEGNALHNRVISQREKRYSTDVSAIVAEIREATNNLKINDEIHAQVMKELG